MATTIYLTQAQIDQIRILRDAGPNAQGNYSHIYKYIGDQLPEGSDVQNWFRGAEQANAGNGAYSALIRGYSKRQMELRGIGNLYTPELMQAASNEVAMRALQDILGENPLSAQNRDQHNGTWLFPTVEEIASNDAIGVGAILFDSLASGDTARSGLASDGGVNAGWAGTILFSPLNASQTWRLTQGGGVGMNSLDDVKNILFAYDALAAGIHEAIISGINDFGDHNFGQFLSDFGIGWDTWQNSSPGQIKAIAFGNLSSLLPPSAQGVGSLIEHVGVTHFLDMLMGARLGYPVYGQTTDANFAATANAFLGAMSPEQIQGLSAQLMPTTAAEMLALVKTDVNARAALTSLSSVSVEIEATAAQALDLYDPATGSGELTDLYLKDRAAMLSWKMKYDSGAKDQDDVLTDYLIGGLGGAIAGLYRNKAYSEEWDTDTINGNWDFIDLGANFSGSPLQLAIDGKGITQYDHQIVFGSQNVYYVKYTVQETITNLSPERDTPRLGLKKRELQGAEKMLHRLLALLLLLAATWLPVQASAWWDPAWSYRMKINLDASAPSWIWSR